MQKSINAWTFAPGTSIREMSRQAAEAGFQALELVASEDGELTPRTREEACAALGRALCGAGLRPAGLNTDLCWRCNLGAPDAASRQEALDLVLALLDRAAWTGVRVLAIVPAVVGRPGVRHPVVSYADALNRTYDALCYLRFEAEQRGVRIAIENVWNRFLLSPVELADLIDRLDSHWIGACFDIGNVMPYGYPEDWITVLGRRIARVHVRDYNLDRAGPQAFCPLGEGHVNWPAVTHALAGAGYKGPLTYEGSGELKDVSKRMDSLLFQPLR